MSSVLSPTIAGAAGPVDNTNPDNWPRIAGADRYATSLAIAREAYPTGADSVYVASGVQWPDALSGATLTKNGPILLARPGDTAGLQAALNQLGAKQAIILGGTGALPTRNTLPTGWDKTCAALLRWPNIIPISCLTYARDTNQLHKITGISPQENPQITPDTEGNPASLENTWYITINPTEKRLLSTGTRPGAQLPTNTETDALKLKIFNILGTEWEREEKLSKGHVFWDEFSDKDYQKAWETLAEIRMRVGGLETIRECKGVKGEIRKRGYGTKDPINGDPGIGGIWTNDPTGAVFEFSPGHMASLIKPGSNYIEIIPNITLRHSHGDNYEEVLIHHDRMSPAAAHSEMETIGMAVHVGVCVTETETGTETETDTNPESTPETELETQEEPAIKKLATGETQPQP